MLEKKYDHKLTEENKYEQWKEKGYFKSGDKSKEPFCIVLPPPNVTGKLHLGHALDIRECKDMTLSGYQEWTMQQ